MTPIQNSMAVAGLKPLETTCSSGTLTSTLTSSCSFPIILSVLIAIETLYPLHCPQLCYSTLKTGYLTHQKLFRQIYVQWPCSASFFEYLSLGCRSLVRRTEPVGHLHTTWLICLSLFVHMNDRSTSTSKFVAKRRDPRRAKGSREANNLSLDIHRKGVCLVLKLLGWTLVSWHLVMVSRDANWRLQDLQPKIHHPIGRLLEESSVILNIWIRISAQLETEKQNSDWLLLPEMVQTNVFFCWATSLQKSCQTRLQRTKWIAKNAIAKLVHILKEESCKF